MRIAAAVLVAALLPWVHARAAGVPDGTPAQRGEYLIRAAGCAACHSVAQDEAGFLAGGRALDTPFGRFYSPNITPHAETGIGRWSADDLWRALSEGRGPDGKHYYPAFPYPTYTRMRREDSDALHAYLMTVAAVSRRNKAHDLVWYASFRVANLIWKWLFLDARRLREDPDRSEGWNRGAYLVEALAHCAECHTPRNWLGALLRDAWLAGNPDGPEGDPVPNITPHESGIGEWSNAEIEEYLASGMDPEGDFAGGAMVDVVDDGTAHLTDQDRAAIAQYLKSLPPIAP